MQGSPIYVSGLLFGYVVSQWLERLIGFQKVAGSISVLSNKQKLFSTQIT